LASTLAPAVPSGAARASSDEAGLALAAAMGGGFSPLQADAISKTSADVAIGAAKGGRPNGRQ